MRKSEKESLFFEEIEELKSKALNEGRRLEEVVLYYLGAELHRSHFSNQKPLGRVGFFVCFTRNVLSLIKDKHGKPPNKIRSKNVLYWCENYQAPEIDDKPFKKIAPEYQFDVVEPTISAKYIIYYIATYLKIMIRLKKALKNVHKWHKSKITKSGVSIKSISPTKYFVHQLAKAEFLIFPHYRDVIRAKKPRRLVSVHRHNGDVSPLLIDQYLRSQKTKSSCTTRKILLAHSSLPVSVPLTMISSYVDKVFVKNEIAAAILKKRDDFKSGAPIYAIGDPRSNISKKQSQTSRPVLTIALTESALTNVKDSHSDKDLEVLNKLVNDFDQRYHVKIKRRRGDIAPSKNIKTRYNNLFSHHQTKDAIVESIECSDLAIVLGNSSMKMISGVCLDYFQAGIPTFVILHEDYLDEFEKNWKTSFPKDSLKVISHRQLLTLFGQLDNDGLIKDKTCNKQLEKDNEVPEHAFWEYVDADALKDP